MGDFFPELVVNSLTRKLQILAPLDQRDRALLEEVTARTRELPARQDLIREGDPPFNVHFVLAGWLCRYKLMDDGSRNITGYMLPGDFCDLHVGVLREMDHSIATITPARIVVVHPSDIDRMLERPAIARALWWASLVDEAILREWLVNVAARNAPRALAHLFCELFVRLEAMGLTSEDTCELPLTQHELAETTGITSVHVNRTLQILRDEGIIRFERKRLTILHRERLFAYADFRVNYLHATERS